jgi:very-short-patch-repair endonuclease
MKTDAGVSSNQRSRARTMRGAPTDSELRLWRLLRDRRLSGFKFRRQVPVGPYIIDFLCVGAKLIVKADAFQHAESPRDKVRDAYLESQGWKVLRFSNNEVVQIAKVSWRQSSRMQTNPHPALWATFSPREKGRSTAAPKPFPLGEKVARRRRDG